MGGYSTTDGRIWRERFIKGDSDGRREVQTSLPRDLRNPHGSVGMGREEIPGDADRFAPENEPVRRGKSRVPKRFFGLAGKEPEVLAALLDGPEERGVIVVKGELEPVPIIHRAAAEIFVAQHKSKGAHEMQMRSRGHARSGDVPRVRRNLRMDQGQVQTVGQNVRFGSHASLGVYFRA